MGGCNANENGTKESGRSIGRLFGGSVGRLVDPGRDGVNFFDSRRQLLVFFHPPSLPPPPTLTTSSRPPSKTRETTTMVDCFLSAFVRSLRPRRTFDNGNGTSTTTRAAAVFAGPPSGYRKALEDGLNEVDDIRSQLEKLQYLVAQEMRSPDETKEALIRENEALRRELLEKDELISSLRQQIAAQNH
ncbi:hypothetical protein RB195_000258 [Necator americanus]|uniref:Uncharacterized protein n=1 Tax=Necator americanus TaxID=51031 RepID=A0ABR1D8S6_NECAM